MSGSTIGGFIGAGVGFFFGPAGAKWGFEIGAIAGGILDPDVIKGQRLTDAQVQTSIDGVMRPIIYGTYACKGNVIQFGPLVEHKHKKRTGKGGPVQESFTYTRTWAIRICEASPTGHPCRLRRAWRLGKLVYDATGTGTISADSAAFASRLTFYDGSETQLPDPTLEALSADYGGGVGNVPAYRGSCYAVIANDDLTESAGAIPDMLWEISTCEAESVPETPVWTHGYDGVAQAVYCTNVGNGVWMIGGDNGLLQRSFDNGTTWEDISFQPYPVCNLIFAGSFWYALINVVGFEFYRSSDNGKSWDLQGSALGSEFDSIAEIDGTIWVGKNDADSILFQLLNPVTTINLGTYGPVTAIAKIGTSYLIGTDSGHILKGGTLAGCIDVDTDAGRVIQFAGHGSTVIAARAAGSYSYSNDGGATWSAQSGSRSGVGYFNGLFYGVGGTDTVYESSSGVSAGWSDADVYATTVLGRLRTTSTAILACSDYGYTTSAGFAGTSDINLSIPDSPDYGVDPQGTVTGPLGSGWSECQTVLSVIVADICDRVGIDASQIDVSALTDSVRGYMIGQQIPAADCIRSLQQGYFFDFPEWDLKLRGVKRGGASLFAITDDDLVMDDGDQDVRKQAIEFPRKLNLIGADPTANYEPIKETASRRTDDVRAVGEATLQLPIAMSRDECAQRADIMLRVLWMEAEGTWDRKLPEEFSKMTPSDPFTHGGKRWRVQKTALEDDVSAVTASRDRISAYSSSATGAPTLTPVDPVSSLKGPTLFAAMNLPRLFTTDSSPGMYIAVMGLLPGWLGCDLQMSSDGGVTFESLATLTTPTAIGRLTADIGSSGEPIPVEMYASGELVSVTADQLAARANGFAIITGGVSEIGQFQNESPSGTARYDLTDVARGQLGTTAASHDAGDRFVMLDNVVFLPLDASLIGLTLTFRPVSIGTAAANNATYDVLFNPLFTGPAVIDFEATDTGEQIVTNTGEGILVTS